MQNPNLDPSDTQFTNDDKQIDRALRPKSLEDFAGQPKIVDNLSVFIQAARLREEAVGGRGPEPRRGPSVSFLRKSAVFPALALVCVFL